MAFEASQRKIIGVLEELIARLPEDTLLVTGGTSAGVEGEVHRLALLHRRRVLATVVEATDPADLRQRRLLEPHLALPCDVG